MIDAEISAEGKIPNPRGKSRNNMAVLTISRDLGSGGREVGLALSSSLGYGCADREDILSRLKAAGHKWEKWTEGFDEHARGFGKNMTGPTRALWLWSRVQL